MSNRRFYAPNDTLTLAEHRALELTRPFTDPPIGGTTDGKRSNEAFLSSLHTRPDPFGITDRKNPTQRDIAAEDKARAKRTREARKEKNQGDHA